MEGDGLLWTSHASPVARLFQNKVTFLLKIMPIYDEPPLSSHLAVPRGWLLYRGSTAFHFILLP